MENFRMFGNPSKPVLTQALLKKLLIYDPETGDFWWKVVEGKRNRFAGQKAGYKESQGYIKLRINNENYFAHRVAYIYHYGVEPDIVDHLNGIKSDNRIINLSDGTHMANMKNRKMSERNKSGSTGVYWLKRGKWQVSICHNYQSIYIGVFDKLEDAITARKNAEKKYGFNKNHGKILPPLN